MTKKPYIQVISYGNGVDNPLSPNNYGVEAVFGKDWEEIRYPLLKSDNPSEHLFMPKEVANYIAKKWASRLGIEARLKS